MCIRDSVNIGWSQADSDITVMAYTGAGVPTLTGKTYDQLIGLGWTSIGNYSDIGTGVNGSGSASVTTSVYSSYWLIGAYNPLASGGTEGWAGKADNIKLASVTGVVKPPSDQQVPEPGSMTLFGVALLGLFGLRKYQKS